MDELKNFRGLIIAAALSILFWAIILSVAYVIFSK